MGWEVELNAIPSHCTLLELIYGKAISAELLTFVRTYFRLRRRQGGRVEEFAQGSAEYQQFVDALEEMIASHPGIEQRCCDLDRRYEWLKWLMIQCATNDEEKKIATEAISGEVQIAPDAVSTQGFPIRITSPAKVELIAVWLDELSSARLRRQFDPDKMRKAGLYKWGPPAAPAETFKVIAEDFGALRAFYRQVSAHSESVLIITD